MRLLHFLLLLFGVGFTFAGPTTVIKHHKDQIEELCARMHNNTAFIGVQPFARLLVDSASKCQKSCMELHPKCTAVVFYYVYGETINHICFMFDKNSVNENVALVPEKPKNQKDVIRALEIVTNCHEFDPFPPLMDPFVVSSDIIGRDKRAIGYNKPIPPTGSWSRWSSCNHNNNQMRSQTCAYGRKIQKRQCAPKYPQQQQTQPQYTPAQPAPPNTPYPPYGYNHPSTYSQEYTRRMEEHKKQENQLCCYKLDYNPGAQVHSAVPKASPCPEPCPVSEMTHELGILTPNPPSKDGFLQWGEWSACSVTCGRGVEKRTRVCTAIACLGPSSETRDCELAPCPGVWTQWCEWNACSVTCGIGKRDRTRYCDSGFGRCQGPDHEESECNSGPCPEWLPWSEWSVCSLTCGGGTSQRFRTCSNGNSCPGSPVEEMRCNEQPCPCWGEWSPYGECSVTCGGGFKTRTRFCEGGRGDDCPGNPLEKLPCGEEPCHQWSNWEQWSECQVTCGDGVRTRLRHCLTGNNCPGETMEQDQCYMGPCPSWGDWQEWGQCSATCGTAIQTRKRYCNGYGCPGSDSEERNCYLPTCPVWGTWGEWSTCSVSCGMGTKERHRTCLGGYCEGERTQTEPCDMGMCPYWSDFNPWSSCSVTCGEGVKTRRRYCIGGNCQGPDEEKQPCREGPCAAWGQWGQWGTCNVPCGPGQKIRTRQCLTAYGGPSEDCIGSKDESISCDAGPCCQWSDWCGWSVCDRDCGGGKKIRQRFCQRMNQNGELNTDPSCQCPGSDKEIQDCNQQRCPPQCAWTEWCPWSQCPNSDPCKNATATRTRQCVGDAGCRCYGYAEEKQFCRKEAVCDPPIVPTAGVRRRRRLE